MPGNIVFFHPDLGIGGAERLVVDAAVGLQSRGHKVTIFTSHCDRDHCFDEARDGTLDVRVRGNVFPDTFLGRFKIFLTILRHYHLLLQITLSGELASLKPSTFFLDQLSAGIPILRWGYPEVKILFYCHYPDLLLVQGRGNLLKRLWRLGFDAVEGWSMRGADRIVVNSKFTRGVVNRVWTGLGGQRGIGVVYPCVKTDEHPKAGMGDALWPGKAVILSINRFERKKDVGLAIRAFAKLNDNTRGKAKLVIAGGYDPRVQENIDYHKELVSEAESRDLKCATAKSIITAQAVPEEVQVIFLQNVPSQAKTMLLSSAKLLVYTPTNEHFGIVPVEGMLAGVPVLATNTGGPTESVVEGQTGWLRGADAADDWTAIMNQVISVLSAGELKRMGDAGKQRVRDLFSNEEMARKLDEEIGEMRKSPRSKVTELQDVLLALGASAVILIATLVALTRIRVSVP